MYTILYMSLWLIEYISSHVSPTYIELTCTMHAYGILTILHIKVFYFMTVVEGKNNRQLDNNY